MSDGPEVRKTATAPDKFKDAGEPTSDQKDIVELRRRLDAAVHDGRQATTPPAAAGGDVMSLATDVARNLTALHQRGDKTTGLFSDKAGGTHDRGELVADTDAKFKALMIAANTGAKGKAGDIFKALQVGPDGKTPIENYDARLDAIKKSIPADELKKMGLDGVDQPTAEQIQSAILKRQLNANPTAPKSDIDNKLTDYLALAEMKNDKIAGTTQDIRDLKAPSMVALAYADFVTRFKGGITTITQADGSAVPITAADIVGQVSQLDKQQTGPPAQKTESDAMTQSIKLLHDQGVADDKNPLISIQAALKDPKNVDLWKKAADQTDDPMFAPDQVKAEIATNKKAADDFIAQVKAGKMQDTPENEQKYLAPFLASQLKGEARSSAYWGLANAELAQPKPDIEKVMKHMDTAITNPNLGDAQKQAINPEMGTALIANRKNETLLQDHPELKSAFDLIRNKDNPQLVKALGQFTADTGTVDQTIDNLRKLQGKPTDEQIAAARKQVDAFYDEGKSLQTGLAPVASGIDKAYKDLISKTDRTPQENDELATVRQLHNAAHGGTVGAMQQAFVYGKTGDSPAAKGKLEEAARDTSAFETEGKKKMMDIYKNVVKEGQLAEHPWSSIGGKSIGTLIALGVGWGVATLLAPETGGMSWAAMGALTASIAAGGVVGTAVGVGIEKYGGARDSFMDGVKDVAPWAFTAASLGASWGVIPTLTIAAAPAAEVLPAAGEAGLAGTIPTAANVTAGLAPAAGEGVTLTTATAESANLAGAVPGAVNGAEGTVNAANAATKTSWLGRLTSPARTWMGENVSSPVKGFLSENVGQPVKGFFQTYNPSWNPAGGRAITGFQNIATNYEWAPSFLGNTGQRVTALWAANAAKYGYVASVGALGMLTTDHPLENYLNYVGTAIAASPFTLITHAKDVMPAWMPLKSFANFAGITAATSGLDYVKNMGQAAIDSRGGADTPYWYKVNQGWNSDMLAQGQYPMPIIPFIGPTTGTFQRDAAMNNAQRAWLLDEEERKKREQQPAPPNK